MKDWCIAHPWMTFFLAALVVYVVDCLLGNICRVIVALKEKP